MGDGPTFHASRTLRLPRRRPTAGDVYTVIFRERDPDMPAWRVAFGVDIGTNDILKHVPIILRLPRGELERLRLALVGHVHPEEMAALGWLLRPYGRADPGTQREFDGGDLSAPAPWPEAKAAFLAQPEQLQDRLTSEDPRQVAGALAAALRAGTAQSVALAWALSLFEGDQQAARRAVAWAVRAARRTRRVTPGGIGGG